MFDMPFRRKISALAVSLGNCVIQGVHEKKNCEKKLSLRPFVPIIRLLKVNRKFSLTVLGVNMAAYTREERMLCGERTF